MAEKKARLGKPAVVKTIDRSVPAEQLRDTKGKLTADPSKDADGKSEVITHRVRAAVKTYWLMNPAGAVHMLPADQARERLHQSKGWRMATKAEIAEYGKRSGNQTFDDPIAAPFVSEPDAGAPELDLDKLSNA